MAHLSIVAGERCGPPHRRRSPARSDRPAARLGAPERRRSRLLRTRWSPHHRGTLRTLGAPALALCLFLLAGSVASAAPTPSSLHERLTRLNARADQTVEQYLNCPGFDGGLNRWVFTRPPWTVGVHGSSGLRVLQVGCGRARRAGGAGSTTAPTPGWPARPGWLLATGRGGRSARPCTAR